MFIVQGWGFGEHYVETMNWEEGDYNQEKDIRTST